MTEDHAPMTQDTFTQRNTCAGCGLAYEDYDPPTTWYCCPQCVADIGPVLAKALGDDFDYVIGLRSGAVIRFHSATRTGEWITLDQSPPGRWENDFSSSLPFPCPRGVSVRLSEIIWAADAPEGS